MSDYALGIDIGGTFTDVVLVEARSGDLEVAKTLTTYPDPSDGVLDGLRSLFAGVEVTPGSVRRVIHGTTQVSFNGRIFQHLRRYRMTQFPVRLKLNFVEELICCALVREIRV